MRVCDVCKLHGVRLIKGIKIFESMLKPKSTAVSEKKTTKFSALMIIIDLKLLITNSAATRNLELKMRVKFVYFAK